MYTRLLKPPKGSFFLFGPRGTGKSSWVRERLPGAITVDLLAADLYLELHADPHRLERHIPKRHSDWIVIDEVQKVPALLDEVHRLIEGRKLRFALTGSSARSLRRRGVNLLAGRAITLAMHPLTACELGDDFDLGHSLEFGSLPTVQVSRERAAAAAYLASYVRTYLKEEVQAEGLTRNLSAFSRFLEAASFSQAAPMNASAVARDCSVERKVVEGYFDILEDLLLSVRIPVFTRRAQRRLAGHPKFFFFDVGVFRALRPRGPLDSSDEIAGAAAETLVFQELRAINDALSLEYGLYTWRTREGLEVDFVLYGPAGLHAIEVKASSRLRGGEARGLEAFGADYPMAKLWLVHGGARRAQIGDVTALRFEDFLKGLPDFLRA
jgi:predicted AAA+ superfamily ATPase